MCERKATLQRLTHLLQVPEEGTIRNDYSANFVDSGLKTLPSAWIGNTAPETRLIEHPRLRRLTALKAALAQYAAIPRTYLQADLRAWIPTAQAIPNLGVLETLGYDVILLDPPLFSYAWNAPHDPQIYPSWSWDDIAQLPIPRIASKDSFVFLWVGDGRDDGLERGRDVLHRWGYRRCEDIVWVQTSERDAYAPQGTSLFVPIVQHCLMGIRGTVVRSTDSFFVHCNVDTDVILWPGERPEPHAPITAIRKPHELYTIIENFCLGTRRLELFGTNRNLRDGWLTVGCDVGPQAPQWPAHGAMPFEPTTYMSYFVLDPPGCPLHCRSNLLPYSEECEQLRPRTPPNRHDHSQHPPNQPGQLLSPHYHQPYQQPDLVMTHAWPSLTTMPLYTWKPRPVRLQPPLSQLLGQGAGGRATVSVPSNSERLSGAQARVLERVHETAALQRVRE